MRDKQKYPSPSASLIPGRLLRINQFIPDIIPISRSGWWDGVKKGHYPQPIKLSPRVTVWKSEELLDLIEQASSGEE